ncbi:hypothetical protein FMM74_020625 [Lachnospiraceae bacterium MD308]|nr:hypothetical protein [Lachnospiraceae bacterium MD308]
MFQERICWEGRCQKVFFLKEDIGHIFVGMVVICFICFWNDLLCNSILGVVINIVLIFAAFYEVIGQFLIRYYYCKNVYYRIKSNQIEIIMKMLHREYIRRYALSDITVISKVIYKGKAGSIHFGDAENKYWERGAGYTGKINPIVTGGGLLRASDKYQSGILYGLEDVDYVYQIIMSLKKDM